MDNFKFPNASGYRDYIYSGKVGDAKLYRDKYHYIGVDQWTNGIPYNSAWGAGVPHIPQVVLATTPGALKYDDDKPMMDLVIDGLAKALLGVGTVLTYGYRKYKGKHGWKKLDDAKARYTAAMVRHMLALASGEKIDPESELNHSWHIACNAMFLAELESMNEPK